MPAASGCGSKWYHSGLGAPPILEPVLVGIGMFTGATGFHGQVDGWLTFAFSNGSRPPQAARNEGSLGGALSKNTPRTAFGWVGRRRVRPRPHPLPPSPRGAGTRDEKRAAQGPSCAESGPRHGNHPMVQRAPEAGAPGLFWTPSFVLETPWV